MVIWSWRSFLYSSSVYSSHLFLISSASVRSIPFLSFIEPIFAWNVPLISLIFLKRSLVFPILLLGIGSHGYLLSRWNLTSGKQVMTGSPPITFLLFLPPMDWTKHRFWSGPSWFCNCPYEVTDTSSRLLRRRDQSHPHPDLPLLLPASLPSLSLDFTSQKLRYSLLTQMLLSREPGLKH